MKRLFLLIIITLSFHYGMRGNPTWTPIDKSESKRSITITTIESNEKTYKAKVEVHRFYDNCLDIEGATYHKLSFDEPGSLSFIGEPALPIISRLIAIPKGNNFEVKISDEKWTNEISIGHVMPCQKDYLETEERPPFEKNEAIYNGDVYQTEKFYVGELQKWRSVNNRALNICPFRYMPREGKMSILKEFILEILFDERAEGHPLKSSDMHLFLNRIDTKESEGTNQLRDSNESYDYLIIAGNIPGVLGCQALADFQKWKAFKGYKTKVVSTITTGTSATQIKQYIANEYPKGLKYVLLVGDSDKIPLYSFYSSVLSGYAKSDYWYGCMDGSDDNEGDICIGRFSTNDTTELANMVNKTISYEKKGRNYGNNVLLVANREQNPYDYQGCMETIRTCNYVEPKSFTTAYGADASVGGNNATNAFVVNNINEGKNIINYRGHGLENRWLDWNVNNESFYDSQINSLNNMTNDVYFCIACLNGNIHNQTCFMETFMRSSHGASGIIAATENTYTLVNHSFNQYLFQKLLNENIYNIGDLNIAAHIANFGTNYLLSVYNAFSYLCGCDPTLEIWTDNTNVIGECTLYLILNKLLLFSHNVSEYKISVVNEDGSLFSIVNVSGSSCLFNVPNGNFYLVLNKHNYVPRIIYVNVTDSYIQNKAFDDENIEYYYLKNGTISAGYDVTTSIPEGNVSIENGNKLNIDKSGGVIIKNGFKCKLGGTLKIE